MFLERSTIRRVEGILILGSALTLALGVGLLFFPGAVLDAIDLAAGPLLFVQMTGLVLGILGAAYLTTLMNNREKNRGILAIGFFQKLGAAVLLTAGAMFADLPRVLLGAAGFDGLMAILFLLHLQGARTDGWV